MDRDSHASPASSPATHLVHGWLIQGFQSLIPILPVDIINLARIYIKVQSLGWQSPIWEQVIYVTQRAWVKHI